MDNACKIYTYSWQKSWIRDTFCAIKQKTTSKSKSILRGKSELNLCIEDHSKTVAVGHSDLETPYRSGTVNDLHIVPPQMRLLYFNLTTEMLTQPANYCVVVVLYIKKAKFSSNFAKIDKGCCNDFAIFVNFCLLSL